jgi:general stress protein YciG
MCATWTTTIRLINVQPPRKEKRGRDRGRAKETETEREREREGGREGGRTCQYSVLRNEYRVAVIDAGSIDSTHQ